MKCPALLGANWRQRILRSVLLFLALIAVLFGWGYVRYPGFARDALLMWSKAEKSDIADLYSYMLYYTDYFSRIGPNPSTGYYDMEAAILAADPDIEPFEYGMLSYHAGRPREAVQHMEVGIQQQGETEHRLFWLGLAYQRWAEQNNCYAHCQDCNDAARFCSLPIVATHQDVEPSRNAVATFEKLLNEYDSSNQLYRWLLNFSYMTLGEYPDGVSSEHLVSNDFTGAFYSKNGHQPELMAEVSLHECAAELNINTNDAGKGVAVEDFNRDGYLDIVTGGTFQDLKYYRNEGGKTFVDATTTSGLADVKQPFIITAADYDNDGWVDLFVSRPFHHFLLLRNREGRFEDVTFSAGLLPGLPSEDEILCTCMSAWGDVNNDGYLDLFIAQLGQRFPLASGLLARKPASSKLFLNQPADSSGTRRKFVDATAQFGLDQFVQEQIFFGAAFGDYDADGWIDLFLSSPVLARSTLLRNLSGKAFTKTRTITTKRAGFTAAFLDINHDGRLDLFHGGHGPAKRNVERAVFGAGSDAFANAVFIQDEEGAFQERTDLFGGGMPIGTMGASYGDFNNDGAFEFYLGTGNPEPAFVLPNLMYFGETEGRQPTGSMSNITMLSGFGTIQKGHGIVFFDYDNDGDQDMYSSLGGMWPGDAWPNQFFRNDLDSKHSWLKLRLRGRESNYYGVSALIRIEAETEAGESLVRFHYMNNKMGFGSAPYLAHIGLMDAVRLTRVDVTWPISRAKTTYTGLEVRKFYLLDENGDISIVAPSGE